MKYSCRTCSKEFDIPALITYRPVIITPITPFANPVPPYYGNQYTAVPQQISTNYEYQIPCCPFCYSKEIEETNDET